MDPRAHTTVPLLSNTQEQLMSIYRFPAIIRPDNPTTFSKEEIRQLCESGPDCLTILINKNRWFTDQFASSYDQGRLHEDLQVHAKACQKTDLLIGLIRYYSYSICDQTHHSPQSAIQVVSILHDLSGIFTEAEYEPLRKYVELVIRFEMINYKIILNAALSLINKPIGCEVQLSNTH